MTHYFFDSLVFDLLKADPEMKLEELGVHLELIGKHNGIDSIPTYNEMLLITKRFYDKGDRVTSDKLLKILEEDIKERSGSK